MKLYLLKYALWLYENYIYEDWDDYNKVGKIFVYPLWFIRACLIWIVSPLFLLSYHFTQSNVYKHYKEFGQSMTFEQQLEMLKQQKVNQKIERNNFLNQKQSKGKYNRKF